MRSQDEQRGFRDVDSILSLDFNDGSGVRYKGFIEVAAAAAYFN